MRDSNDSGLARLKLLWPEQRLTLHARWRADAQFRELCEAYELAFRGLDHWLQAPDPLANERIDEYRALIAATEQDILEMINSASGARKNSQTSI